MKKTLFVIALTALFFTGCGVVTNGALHSARNNLEDKDYEDVMVNLTEANFSGLKQEQKPEVAFLKANALYGLGRIEEAKGILLFINDRYPASRYAPQARSLMKKWEREEMINNGKKEDF